MRVLNHFSLKNKIFCGDFTQDLDPEDPYYCSE